MLCNDRFLGLKNKNNPLTSMLCLNKCRAYWVIDATEQVTNQDNKKLFADTRQPQICHVFPPVGNALNTILKDGRQKSHIKSYILKFSAFYASLTDLFFFFSLEFFFGYRLREGIQNCFPSRRCIPLTILEAVWHPWCILASEPPAGRTMARHSPWVSWKSWVHHQAQWNGTWLKLTPQGSSGEKGGGLLEKKDGEGFFLSCVMDQSTVWVTQWAGRSWAGRTTFLLWHFDRYLLRSESFYSQRHSVYKISSTKWELWNQSVWKSSQLSKMWRFVHEELKNYHYRCLVK